MLWQGSAHHAGFCIVQVHLLETLPGFVPAIRTFLEQWQPNVAIFMVSVHDITPWTWACISCEHAEGGHVLHQCFECKTCLLYNEM